MQQDQFRGTSGVGLVLSGGGAKGAYHAGVLKALNELDIRVDMLAGASIGALNGALIAAATDQREAARHLETLWRELAEVSPVKFNSASLKVPAYLSMLGAFGLRSSSFTAVLAHLQQQVKKLPPVWHHLLQQFAPWTRVLEKGQDEEPGLLCDQRIKQLIDRYLGPDGLPERLPLYVSLYPTNGVGNDLLRILGASLGIGDTAASEFLKVQSLVPAQQKAALLASAALPMLYAAQEINGHFYSDGGQGGWREVQGNTPIQPMIDAGCRNVIVTHLTDGSMWDRTRFSDVNIIEIRPKTGLIKCGGAVLDVIGFDNDKILSWMRQGYDDTLACIAPIKKTLSSFCAMNRAEERLDVVLGQTGEKELRDAMRLLVDKR